METRIGTTLLGTSLHHHRFLPMCVRLAILLASTSVAGCSGPGRNAELPQGEADDRRFENVRILGANADLASEGISVGRFIQSGSCLLFEAEGGARHNPVIKVDASICPAYASTCGPITARLAAPRSIPS
jgi:hypothetical protein